MPVNTDTDNPPRRRLAEIPLDEFVSPYARVVDESSFSPRERHYIYHVERAIHRAGAELFDDPSLGKSLAFERRDDIRFVQMRPMIMVIERATGDWVGGVSCGMPFVLPEHRLRGINRDLHLLADEHDLDLFAPSYYSTGGYRARLAAHREAVIDAVLTGRPVLPENLVRYQDVIAARRPEHASLEI